MAAEPTVGLRDCRSAVSGRVGHPGLRGSTLQSQGHAVIVADGSLCGGKIRCSVGMNTLEGCLEEVSKQILFKT